MTVGMIEQCWRCPFRTSLCQDARWPAWARQRAGPMLCRYAHNVDDHAATSHLDAHVHEEHHEQSAGGAKPERGRPHLQPVARMHERGGGKALHGRTPDQRAHLVSTKRRRLPSTTLAPFPDHRTQHTHTQNTQTHRVNHYFSNSGPTCVLFGMTYTGTKALSGHPPALAAISQTMQLHARASGKHAPNFSRIGHSLIRSPIDVMEYASKFMIPRFLSLRAREDSMVTYMFQPAALE